MDKVWPTVYTSFHIMKNSFLSLVLVALVVVVASGWWLFSQQPEPVPGGVSAPGAVQQPEDAPGSPISIPVPGQPLVGKPEASSVPDEAVRSGVSADQEDSADRGPAAAASLPDTQVSKPPLPGQSAKLAPPGEESAEAAPIGPFDGPTVHGEDQDAADNPSEPAVPDGKEVITGTVSKGDTAAVLLNTWLPSGTVYSLLEVTRKVYSLSQIHEGQPYTLVRDTQSGQMESFEYEIDVNRKLVVQREGDNLAAKVEAIEYDTKLTLVTGTITSSLFQAMTDAGEQPGLVMVMADIYAWEINFIKDLREGDSFSLLVEKRYRDGEFRNYGKVLAATFVNQGTAYQSFRFADRDGRYRFFNPKGESLEKTLLKAPLPVTRVTSGYTMSRLHPIFNVRRPHQGVDYGAPAGTPIKAVGGGVVVKSGWAGGYGKQVVIRHSGKLESMYSHMSGYARGMKAGIKVRQGQIIGYVGSTGNATGPHLDFRLMQNGSFVNPSKAINPRVDDLPKNLMSAFSTHMGTIRQYLEGKKPLDDYKP